MAAGTVPALAAPSDSGSSAVRTERLRLYAGTAPATTAVGAVAEHTVVTADGLSRMYRLFVPAGLTARAPLVLALHGGLGSGGQFAANSGLDGLATANGFMVAYPEGVTRFPDGSGGARTWNAGRCCGPAVTRGIDDVAFLRSVVKDIEATHSVDPRKVYAIGHSNGGMMALRLACEASDVFAAVGAQSATLEIPVCSPRQRVSLLQIHGTADTNVPIAGGEGSGIAGVAFAPPRQAAQTLARANGCRGGAVRVRDASNRDLLLSRWRSCGTGLDVRFLAVRGAGHAWMGHPSASAWADEYMGSPYMSLDSSRALWAFVSAHPRESVRSPLRRSPASDCHGCSRGASDNLGAFGRAFALSQLYGDAPLTVE